MNISRVVEKLNHEYRKMKKLQMRKELQDHETPSEELKREICELNGYLRGLKKSMTFVDEYRNGAELPLFGEESA